MYLAGKSADYVTLSLKEGSVSLVVNLGSGAFEVIVEPEQGIFNDNQWHSIRVNRTLREVRLVRIINTQVHQRNCSSNVFEIM